ncbi:hypothetical protein ACFPZ0_06965 [Streptomonospora nanhaiensis]|uniref:hypothetical protein n=1 Tax=Streptomonospora nanhaiensis TaxID=1323731 RepID=UPI001C99E44F|nr:hypothetical protein [Streptomonospora nanhaiensis]MBX9387024.1 hypothetical protein [Streptomonospora nanhaiensis]
MSNPSIASKVVSWVKGIFGQREQTTEPRPQAAPPGNKAEPATSEAAAGTPAAEQPAGTSPLAPTDRPDTANAPDAEIAVDSPTAGPPETTPSPSAPAEPEEPAAEATPAAEEAAKAEEADKATEESPAAKPEPAGAAKAEPAEAEAEPAGNADDNAVADTDTKGGDLVDPGEQAAVAEELAAAEAVTQVADDAPAKEARRRAAPTAEELPVPGYEGLTLPSVRARLRKLTIDQVRDLRAYEVAHGERQEFIRMYDNRIAKLQSEGQ